MVHAAHMGSLMSIGEFSAGSGLSPSRLRKYASAGVLVPAAVDSASGYRYYSGEQLVQAKLVEALRAAGVPLAAIPPLLMAGSAQDLDRWARDLEVDALRRREALTRARELLDNTIASSGPLHLPPESRTTMTKLVPVSRSETGPVREQNQDDVTASERLVAVADGMGGGAGGCIASSLALSVLDAAFIGSLAEMEAGVRAANRAINERANSTETLEGMGTTLCAVGVTSGGELVITSVGDSRVYLLRHGELRQLTQDHSVTAEMVRKGELTADEAADHPHRHVLTRVLGPGPVVEVDSSMHLPHEGDRLMLCTDGLFNELSDHDLQSLLQEPDAAVAVDRLVDQALAAGGKDNVTVAVVDVSL